MEHEFALDMTLPITRKEANALLSGERRVFRKIDPFSNQVSLASIGCTVCGKGGVECISKPECPGAPARPDVEPVDAPPKEENDGAVEDN